MDKKNLTRILAIVLLAFMLIGLTFFRKESDEPIQEEEYTRTTEEVVGGTTEEEEKDKISSRQIVNEQKNGQEFIESFMTSYKSYVYGDFSDTESLYYMMTEDFKAEEVNRITELREGTASQNRTTVEALILESDITYYNHDTREITVSLLIRSNYYGGVVISSPTAENEDANFIIRENGTRYEGNLSDLLYSTTEESLEVSAVMQDNGLWKISEINSYL